ncbi:glycosyltransferase family 2 protein [Kiritimatiella glycovorans]|uniref:Undecaprenyl-phosphate 4-deoxy-4-formamido-L-arabinose transferase n=1 Tax=Kiritimatiella glycovorans TaxID=1307763 RepID=A0A0G3EI12_9BACT|nr:glycosyltransferase family 2 protein [Kiritimatiella glycovorans]AKJ65072.1 Undecaprenyl-phosphate 4-deoxy-4-formamido-L-arabinose transferase [Kiritimatiella glycovorans]
MEHQQNRTGAGDDLELSVVVPVYNEEPNVRELSERILAVGREMAVPFEVILVDDGSTDGTPDLLRSICREQPECRAVLFRRNFGQSAAMTAGFHHTRGRVVVSMDGDLQNDPADIPELVSGLQEGYDIVCGWRKDRQDRLLTRRIPSQWANRLIGRLTGVRLHDYGCSLKAYEGDLVRDLVVYGELHRFIPVLLHLRGANMKEVVVRHHARTRGESKYNLSRMPTVVLDLMLMLFFQRFQTRPLQFFGRGGGLMLGIGVLIELYLTVLKFGFGQDIGDRPLLQLGALLIISGFVVLGIGLVSEIVMRAYYETSGRTIYSIREVVE